MKTWIGTQSPPNTRLPHWGRTARPSSPAASSSALERAGIDPESGSIPEGIEAQTEQALRNLAAILDAAGASMTDLVKTTIFYSDVADFATLNEVYARHMPDPPPARSAPANVRLPHGLLVSIEAIAALPS
jgi:2-iminobutanoate/2-iminopropanoate deaminase